MLNKILFISNIANKVGAFSKASITAAHEIGAEFIMAANWQDVSDAQIAADEEEYNVKVVNVPISRNPFSRSNKIAYEKLVDLVKREGIDCIHCNTPTGGLLGRLVGKKCKVKKVIYQAHGFHFYKGAPLKNWLLYYPVEKWLAHYTDVMITINSEDYELATHKFKLRGHGRVHYVPGVGIDLSQYGSYVSNIALADKRKELHIPMNAFVLISVGELNTNKNNGVVISALEKLGDKNIHYVLCGIGNEQEALQKQADRAGLHDNVHFLGYRTDVRELYRMADCFVTASLREGLPRSTMEAMACGLPCVASKIRGNVDLLNNSKLLFCPHDINSLLSSLKMAMEKNIACVEIEQNCNAIRRFSSEEVIKALKQVYSESIVVG